MLDVKENRLAVRRLRVSDLTSAHVLSAEMGWPHRIEDWEFIQQLGSSFGAFDGSGALAGTALWWEFGDRFAMLGMVIVSRVMQGRGIGRGLMQAVIEDAGPRTMILNSTLEGRRLYNSAGFHPVGTVRQYQGIARTLEPAEFDRDERIRLIGRRDLKTLIKLDEAAIGMPRDRIFQSLHLHGSGIVLDLSGVTVGFSFFRRFGRGYVIGPVVAPDGRAAQVLIEYWLRLRAGSFIRIDTPVQSNALSAWLEKFGLKPVGEVATMSRGEPPEAGQGARIFALVSQALG